MSNKQLPRLESNASNRHTFVGWGQVVLGASMILVTLIVWIITKIATSSNISTLTYFIFWLLIVIGLWFINTGVSRLYVNGIFRRLQNNFTCESPTIEELAENIGVSSEKLLEDISIMNHGKYWRTLRVSDSNLEITPMKTFSPTCSAYNITAGEGKRFSLDMKHEKMSHLVSLFILVALVLLLPLPFNNILWILAAIVFSFPFTKLLSKLLPKKQFISYGVIPVYSPEKIELELSGHEQADELIRLSEKYLGNLQELDMKIEDEHLSKRINEISVGVQQMNKELTKVPEKYRQVRQMLDYSLPTAIELFYKYVELEAQPIKGENIERSIGKIHEMSDLVASTFQREINSLYQDQNLNIEVDVEVMRNMLQQESLQFSPLLDSLAVDYKNQYGDPNETAAPVGPAEPPTTEISTEDATL